jgi:hypothetical protein
MKRKRKRNRKPRRDPATREACAEICRLVQILGRMCRASGVDASKIPITCESVIESHYILDDDGSYIRRYGGRKKL